jgi:hypothetical protein
MVSPPLQDLQALRENYIMQLSRKAFPNKSKSGQVYRAQRQLTGEMLRQSFNADPAQRAHFVSRS